MPNELNLKLENYAEVTVAEIRNKGYFKKKPQVRLITIVMGKEIANRWYDVNDKSILTVNVEGHLF